MDVEENKYFGLCKCCLRDGCFRCMWVKYNEGEGAEVQNYGEMLNECFALHWEKPDNDHLDQICDSCIQRTEDAYSFWKQVVASQDHLNHVVVKEENVENYELHEDPEDVHAETETLLIYRNEDPNDPNDPDYLDQDVPMEDFEEVEYLEIDNENETGKELTTSDLTTSETPKRRWPKKKKKGEGRSYRNYTVEDLSMCLEAAKSGKMSVAQAAQHYNVPRKTVAAKLLMEKRGEVPKLQSASSSRSRHLKFVEEVRTMLTYTNATPYKTRTAHYHCAYCSTAGPLFEDADELRTHTRTQHAGERTKYVEQFLQPLWLNEVLKVDIENLHCTVCCVVLTSWNDMFKHLKEQHNLDFDEAYTRIIPYRLQRELRCALCKEAFANYHHLDVHMNAHYSNHVCAQCGDTFLSDSRLKKHMRIHKTGKFLCGECGKTFLLEKYRRNHIDVVHNQEQNVKCLYCPEKFHGTYPRHQHVMQCHREKVSLITCELCGKIFDWRPYYLAHIRRKHKNEKKYQCNFCEAQFFMKSELTRHRTSHTGKKFVCGVCKKKYTTKWALTIHFKVHLGDQWRPGVKLVTRNRKDT